MSRRDRVRRAEEVFAARLQRLGPGDLAIDCGANRGKISRKLARTGAEVIAYEPDPVIFAHLSRVAEAFPTLRPHCAAVGLEAGTAVLYRSPY